MNIIRTIIAGTVLSLGAGVALAQVQATPPAGQEATPADEAAAAADVETTASGPDAASAWPVRASRNP